MNPKVDAYFTSGCGRCKLFNTPQCKVFTWEEELKMLRTLVLDCGLTEELKWGVPVYTYEGNNVVLVSAFKDYCTLSFFKGALLADPNAILITQTENSQSARQARFTGVQEIVALESVLRAYIDEAIATEKAGLKVNYKKVTEYSIPEELQQQFDAMPDLKVAFEGLTPGRQRGYLLHFAGAKQAKTRIARIEKFIPQILAGKGMDD